MGSLLMQGDEFQHILRLLNTNVDGKSKIQYALTSIRGIGRRFANLVIKKAEVDLRKRAGGCCQDLTGCHVLRRGFMREDEQKQGLFPELGCTWKRLKG